MKTETLNQAHNFARRFCDGDPDGSVTDRDGVEITEAAREDGARVSFVSGNSELIEWGDGSRILVECSAWDFVAPDCEEGVCWDGGGEGCRCTSDESDE